MAGLIWTRMRGLGRAGRVSTNYWRERRCSPVGSFRNFALKVAEGTKARTKKRTRGGLACEQAHAVRGYSEEGTVRQRFGREEVEGSEERREGIEESGRGRVRRRL